MKVWNVKNETLLISEQQFCNIDLKVVYDFLNARTLRH